MTDTASGAAYSDAESLRREIGRRPCVRGDDALPLTASFGVATLAKTSETLEELMSHADRCLYEAKQTGRNRVVVDDALNRPARSM